MTHLNTGNSPQFIRSRLYGEAIQGPHGKTRYGTDN
jgi:hypothetical protein